MSTDKLQPMEETANDEFDAAAADDGSDSDDGGGAMSQQDKQQRRKRRRMDAAAAAAAEAAQTGEKDHLFFSLKADPASTAAASTLVIRGFSCTLHADSTLAAALRSESHLQFLDTAPPRVAVENADDAEEAAEYPLPTSLDKYDVRLTAPVAEWRQTNVDEDRDDDLDEPAPVVIPEEDQEALAAKVSAPFNPTALELSNEKLSKDEYLQLHHERYADWWSALKNQPAASDEAAAALGGDSTMSDAAPTAPSMDRAINQEEDPETLEEEARKRRLMAEKGQLWSFNYEDSASSKPATVAAASASGTGSMPAAADATRVAGVKRPPPPPPRKRGPPPPPPRAGKAAGETTQQTSEAAPETLPAAAAAAPSASFSAAAAASDKPRSAAFRPSFSFPSHLVVPLTLSEHRLILRAARFILSLGPAAGPPQEVLMKVKHAQDSRFWFLMHDHPLHGYYEWIKEHPEVLDMPETNEGAAAPTEVATSSPSATATPPAVADTVTQAVRVPPGMRAPPGMRKPTGSDSLGSHATPPATPPVSMPASSSSASAGWPSTSEATTAEEATGSLAGLLSGYGDSDDDDDGQTAKHSSATSAAAAASSQLPPLPLPPLPLPPRPVAVSLPLPPLPPVLPIPPSLLPLLPAPPAPIPPAATLKVIHKLCAYLHKHGPSFERLTAARERTNPAFEFLKPDSLHQPYFEWAKYIQPMVALEEKSIAEKAAKQQQQQQSQADTVASSPEPPPQSTPLAASAASSSAGLSALDRSIAAAKMRALEIMQTQKMQGGSAP